MKKKNAGKVMGDILLSKGVTAKADLIVAEVVMGWKRGKNNYGWEGWQCDAIENKPLVGDRFWEGVWILPFFTTPEFSTDPLYTDAIVKRMNELGYACQIEKDSWGYPKVYFHKPDEIDVTHGYSWHDLPRAVAGAAVYTLSNKTLAEWEAEA